MRKIRVLRIINRFNIGGPTYNATFLTAFLGEDYETLLVGGLPEKGESDSLYILDKYDVKPILIKEMKREPSPKNDLAALKKLKALIREFNPDIVHTHASKAGALGRKAASACKVPVIVHTFHGHVFHSYFGKLKTTVFKNIERNLAKKSTAIVAISDIQKKELSSEFKICKNEKINVVPLGFDLEPFKMKRMSFRDKVRTKYRLEEDVVAVAIVGRLAPIKNHKMFLDVVEKIQPDVNSLVKYFIVGDGDEREWIAERVVALKEKGVEVEMTSWIEDIGEFNAGMDIVCLTSKNEGTPVSLIEAQAGGIPVLSTNVGGVKDIVDEGNTGYVVEKDNTEEFAKKLLELVNNKEKRTFMSQNGWNFVKDKFHYTTLVRNVDELYKRLLEENEVEL